MSGASVFYKFKSARTPSRITFDGSGISVWDLKRQIMLQNRMGKGTDFDLAVCSAETEEEYKDDFILPRASSVVARRMPPKKAGQGRAQQYVADLAPTGAREDRFGASNAGGIAPPPAPLQRGIGGQLSKRFDGKEDVKPGQHAVSPKYGPSAVQAPQECSREEGADEGIGAFFAANTEAWDETQERMSHATYRQRGGAPPRGGPPRPAASGSGPGRGTSGGAGPGPNAGHAPERPPPIGYICFRCGTKGHWIHDCPTNDDREFDNRPRFKRTTGIPKSMLKTVEAPAEGASGVMVTPDGEYVVAQVDNATWEKARSSRKPLSRADIFSSVPSDATLACALCSKLLRNAVRTPCCSTVYCEECIQTHLLDNDFACAECDTRIRDLTSLKPDDAMRERVRIYVGAELEKSERERGEIAAREAPVVAPKEPQVEGSTEEGEEKTDETQKDSSAAPAEEGALSQDSAPEQATAKPAGRTPAAPRSSAPSRHGLPARPGGADASEGTSSSTNTAAMAADESHSVPWNPQAAQQIMMMLASPVLPPAMRMQLQMQLQMMQASFMRSQQQGVQAAPAMPWNGAGMPMNMMMGGMAQQQQQQQQQMGNRPTPPPAVGDSAYMRLPVNPNKRSAARGPGVKRDRPTDFQEIAGGADEGAGEEQKYARLQ